MKLESEARTAPHQDHESLESTLVKRIGDLESRIHVLEKTIKLLEENLTRASGRYVAVCPGCRAPFDMLAHHYSIGLFDNLVYVKCPKCQKSLPLKGGGGGEVSLVTD